MTAIDKACFEFLCLEKTAIGLSSCSSTYYKCISVFNLLNFAIKTLLNTKDICIRGNKLILHIFKDCIGDAMLT